MANFQKFRIILSWKIQIVFIFTGILIGLLVTAQFRNAIPTSTYPSDELHTQDELIKSYSDDQAVLKTKILNLRQEIADKQQQSGELVEKNNLDILDNLKNKIGLESVKGEGLEIVLDDGLHVARNTTDGIQQSLVQAADLRDLVNLLFGARAEAIALNDDQRIIASSPITSVGNTILVNNFHMLPPFKITVIGDPELILPRLNDAEALPDLWRRIHAQQITFKVSVKKNLAVPVFNSDLPLRYMEEASS